MDSPFNVIDDLIPLCTHSKKIVVGIDFGLKIMGLSRSDTLKSFAHPWQLYRRIVPIEKDVMAFSQLLYQESIGAIIWGWPLYTQTAQQSTMCTHIEQYASYLKEHICFPQFRWDERLSSVAVARLQSDISLSHTPSNRRERPNGRKGQKSIKRQDDQASAFMLQGVLDFLKIHALSMVAVMVTSLLIGCSSRIEEAGPVTPVTGICRSCKPYYCRGDWYAPQSHYEYQEKGMASWYGPRFHAKPKATGELYNQMAITAAHRTLPLPSIVRVTKRLGNGMKHSINVLVDDRGPYTYAGRIIDLSLGTARALGIDQVGIGHVEVQCLVEPSNALSRHLVTIDKKTGRCSRGRSWLEIYNTEVAPRHKFPLIDGSVYLCNDSEAQLQESFAPVQQDLVRTTYVSRKNPPKPLPCLEVTLLKNDQFNTPSLDQLLVKTSFSQEVKKPSSNVKNTRSVSRQKPKSTKKDPILIWKKM